MEGDNDPAFIAQAARSHDLHIGLLNPDYNIIASLPADLYLPERIAQLQPDMIIIDAESDARDVLKHVVIATRDARRAIVLFAEDDKESSMEAVMAAGVSAYIVAGLKTARIKPALEVAILRFKQEQQLLNESSDTKLKLADRKVIDCAKGLLMEHSLLSEQDAYKKLRRLAMNKNFEVIRGRSAGYIDANDLLG
ncbi:MAG: ANTAR domain-containing protein [Glaciimonas sp.]|nr:ANTAR domain-containing protein [Glaciimonas sp.]